MKKSIVLAIVSLAAGMATSSYGQGAILLDNYNTYGPNVTYGLGSDGALGTGVNGSYTMGVYYYLTVGNNAGLVNFDSTGIADPTTLGNLLLGSGLGSTTHFASVAASSIPGQAFAGDTFGVPGSLATGGQLWTFMIVAYNGASYALATDRGHSAAFNLTTSANTSPTPVAIGTGLAGFSVFVVPEPTTLALGALGGLSLLLFRRKQS